MEFQNDKEAIAEYHKDLDAQLLKLVFDDVILFRPRYTISQHQPKVLSIEFNKLDMDKIFD